MAGTQWTKVYWSDLIGDTLSLTAQEFGAYMLLLAHYYQREEPLPLDRDVLYRIARAASKAEQKGVDRVVASYFIECDGQLWNARADREIANRRKNRENGKKGGRPRLGVVK